MEGREVGERRRRARGKEKKTGQHGAATKQRRAGGDERLRGEKEKTRQREEKEEEEGVVRRMRVDVVLTLISLRMTSIMLPITMRKSNTFQGSLKYPYTG